MDSGRETLGQCLARMIAKGTTIDTTTGTEATESLESETFHRSMVFFAGDKNKRAKKAKKHTDGPGELVFSTDYSRLNSGHTGSSVA